MTRLIDADALKEKMLTCYDYSAALCNDVEELIDNAPTVEADSDLISRADAMGAVQDHFNDDGFKGYDDGQKMLDRINALPSADRPSGEWIEEYDDDGVVCSVCGKVHGNTWQYCPSCGARMEETK